jgi:hypothetical protein
MEKSHNHNQTFWIAHFIYEDPEGRAKTYILTIEATDMESARATALPQAPSENFILDILPQSEEQFLSQVRQQAGRMAGKGEVDPNYLLNALKNELSFAQDSNLDLNGLLGLSTKLNED